MKRMFYLAFLLAVTLLPQITAGNDADYKTLFEDGKKAYSARDYKTAEVKLVQAQKSAVKDFDKYAISVRLANIYYVQKKYAPAISEARKVLNYEKCGKKEKASYGNLIIDSYLKLGKYPEALFAADVVVQRGEDVQYKAFYRMAVLYKAQTLLLLKRPKEAADLLAGLQNNEKYPVMTRARQNWLAGCAADALGKKAEAKVHFRKNLKIDGKWFSLESRRLLDILENGGSSAEKTEKKPVQPATDANKHNILPDGSFEYSNGGAWNRLMLATHPHNSYLPEDCKWTIDDKVFYHGKRSLRSNGRHPLLLQFEGEVGDSSFSIYCKGADNKAAVKIEIFGYDRFTPKSVAAKTFKLNSNWQQCSIKIPRKWFSVDKETVPVEIYITPLNDTTVWVDAAQYERGAVSGYKEYKTGVFNGSDALKEFKLRAWKDSTAAAAVEKHSAVPAARSFSVKYPVAADNVPITVAIPFARGKWFGNAALSVESLADGKRYPAQGVISGRWINDRSVRVLCVSFNAPLSGKTDKFKLHFSSAVPAEAKVCRTPEITVYADAVDGTRFTSQELVRRVVNRGELFTDEVRQGLLRDKKDNAPAMYSLHLRHYHHDNSVKIDCNILNMQSNAIAIREAALVLDSQKSGKAAAYKQHYSHSKKSFLLPPDGSYGKVSANGGTLLVREASLRHPVKLTVDEKGKFTGYLWNSEYKTLALSRRMNLSREFIYTPGTGSVENYGYRSAAIAEVQDIADSGMLMMPLGTISEKTHPYAVKNFRELREKILVAPEKIFSNKSKLIHGLFNYGDVYGDRGWSNQESYMDYSGMCFALLMNDLDVLQDSFRRARHYRDVDIVDGVASYHSPGHTSGPTYEYSHSWPQGVILHYLLTGETRDWEVVSRVIDRYLATPVEYKYITDSRSLGRFLLGLSDFYAITGDTAILDRFFVQLARAEKENLGPDFKDQTIFHWHGRCDPFHIWYGCLAFYQMYQLTGQEELLKAFKREMDASLNMDFFRHDLNELWFGVANEKAWPIQLGFHSHHRGSLFYPMMRFYAEKFNKPEYLKIAQIAAYAQFLRGDNYSEPMDIFRTSVLGDADEKTLLDETLKLRRDAAPGKGTVINGDFSIDSKWFKHWHVPADRQMSYDDVMESWPLPEVKDLKKITAEHKKLEKLVSPWRGYARKYAYMDHKEFFTAPPSLKITSFGSVSVECAPAVITPGVWKFSGAFKCIGNIDHPKTNFTLCYTEEKEKTRAYRIKPLSPDGPAELNIWHGEPILKDVSVKFIATDKPGWRKFEYVFRNQATALITLKSFLRTQGGKDAVMWLDDIKLERIK